MGGRQLVILNRIVRVDFTEKIMINQRLQRCEELAMYITSKAEGTASTKVLRHVHV